MRSESKVAIVFLLLLIVIPISITYFRSNVNVPTHNMDVHNHVGKCYVYGADLEEWERNGFAQWKVMEVGKKHYRVCLTHYIKDCSTAKASLTIADFDKYYSEVPCE